MPPSHRPPAAGWLLRRVVQECKERFAENGLAVSPEQRCVIPFAGTHVHMCTCKHDGMAWMAGLLRGIVWRPGSGAARRLDFSLVLAQRCRNFTWNQEVVGHILERAAAAARLGTFFDISYHRCCVLLLRKR